VAHLLPPSLISPSLKAQLVQLAQLALLEQMAQLALLAPLVQQVRLAPQAHLQLQLLEPQLLALLVQVLLL
jgi:hypothetical protein